MQNIDGKVVIITGASSGIGAETARVLAANGAKVVLSARREKRLEALTEELGADHAAYLASDVTSLKDMRSVVVLARERFGKVDALFANAGIMPGSNMSELDVTGWMSMVDIRTTTIYPGAIKTELLSTVAPSEAKTMVEQFYENVGLEPNVIANAVLYALSQPDNVDVCDLVVRPNMEA